MPKITLPIANGFYVSDSLPISAQRCVNFYPNVPQTASVTQANLFGTPGLNELINISDTDRSRGSHVMAGIYYNVIGTSLYRINRTIDANGNDVFTSDNLGTIEGSESVYMADNGTQLCIVAIPDSLTTGKSYIFTEDPDTLVEITDPDFDGPAASVVYVDGFFVFHKSDGKKFFNSAIQDGTTYDPDDFSQAVADPDDIRALQVYKNQLYVLGSETTEIFRNIGRSPAPFQRIPGAVIDVGIVSPRSTAIFGGSFAFVGASVNESPAVWSIAGGSKVKLSTTAIDNELSKLSDSELDDVFAWTYSESGAYWYGITLPGSTYVYDTVNKRWHERQSFVNRTVTSYRVANMATAYGRVIVGDRVSGKIGEIDENIYLEYDGLIRRFVTTQPFDRSGDPVFIGSVEAVIEAGVGLANDIQVEVEEVVVASAGADPQITFFWSDQYGAEGTFVGGLSRSMGKIGERNIRPIWYRVGRFPRARVLKFEVSTPNKAVIVKVEADVA